MNFFIFFDSLVFIAIVNISMIYILGKFEIINVNLKDEDELMFIILLNIMPVVNLCITIALISVTVEHFIIKIHEKFKR